ncbi:MAG: TetR/AcrR family transcriptional regulator [Roseinatronobacter sp.]|uniref:TetR family transcriptional regulator n=1 Tax=Roseinatronobacter monicus TaxID=393481 RepID=A0A543KGW5_9RHOB|nr:TetR/AcrR family transcriptional regulator [Roseinatronobacter monicus]TQM94319.1 TetR family transcriptional regulator [Roseinatronobacter monicus]TVQ05132.1 MAG: TetR/AcrR family transcriptional regulator [Roseinatronobacter sp.]
MNAPATAIRQGRKYEQVLEGARTVFVAMGYERASVDEIARVAAVSKATLYAYFPEKRLLFTEVYRTEILRLADSAIELSGTKPPEIALREAARRFLAYLTSDFAIAMYRICVAETPRFPEIGQAFYESGPELGRARLGDYLRCAQARGQLQIDDIDLAADQFFQLCQSTVCDRILCGVQTQFSEDEMMRIVNGAVETFLARYGT